MNAMLNIHIYIYKMIYLNANNSMDIFHIRPGIMIDNELKKTTLLLPNGMKHRLCGALISSV